MKLEKEYNYYLKCKKIWLENYEENFVLIKDDIVAGFFETEMDAYGFGLNNFGDVPMFIHQILKKEPIVQVYKEN